MHRQLSSALCRAPGRQVAGCPLLPAVLASPRRPLQQLRRCWKGGPRPRGRPRTSGSFLPCLHSPPSPSCATAPHLYK